jgi:hypothetical protein
MLLLKKLLFYIYFLHADWLYLVKGLLLYIGQGSKQCFQMAGGFVNYKPACFLGHRLILRYLVYVRHKEQAIFLTTMLPLWLVMIAIIVG